MPTKLSKASGQVSKSKGTSQQSTKVITFADRRAAARAANSDELTFDVTNIVDSTQEGEIYKSGNIHYFVVTHQGKEISWWESQSDDLIEDHGDGTCSVKQGVTVGDDGSLYPKQAAKKDIFSSYRKRK